MTSRKTLEIARVTQLTPDLITIKSVIWCQRHPKSMPLHCVSITW